jgi:hypothetical protein
MFQGHQSKTIPVMLVLNAGEKMSDFSLSAISIIED